MADIQLDTQGVPATPAGSTGILYLNNVNKELVNLDDAGNARTVRTLTNAGSTVTAGADIYIVGSSIIVPPTLVRVGSQFIWQLLASKTNAGVVAPIYNIRVGTAGAIGDAVRLTWTSAFAQTAVVDNGIINIACVVTTAGAAGIINGSFLLSHKAVVTGFSTSQIDAQGPTASGAFDLSAAAGALVFGLSINPGAAGVWTITTIAQGLNL